MNRKRPQRWALALVLTLTASISGNADARCRDLLTGKEPMAQQKYKVDQDGATLYSTGYEIFLRRTNFRDRIEEKVRDYLRSRSSRLGKTGEPIRILEIGCGNGEMTVRYLRALRAVLPDVKIQIDLVEPAHSALTETVEAVSSIDSNIEARPFPVTMDTFSNSREFQTAQYDWVIGSYVFYHVDPVVVPSLLDRLSTDGVMMIAMGSPNHPLREPAILKALSKHGDSRLVSSVLGASAIRSRFQQAFVSVRTEVTLAGLWNDSSGFSEDGKAFFSFIYNYDLQRFTDEQRGALDELLATIFERQDGKVFPEHHLFWVWRK